MRKIQYYYRGIIKPHWKNHFLQVHIGKKHLRILDVGCGNDSVSSIKKICPNCYYIGVDIGDYNLGKDTKSKMDEYHIVSPENFANKLEEFIGSIDVVISSHNIEHCNEPYQVLKNMVLDLKPGGSIYLSFPSEASVTFPNRGGYFKFL